MGLFDWVNCKYPLPVEGANALRYQTKDTDCPYMEHYEIREDGSLWREEYDTVDRSDHSAPLGSLKRIQGMMTRENQRWEPEPFTGELVCVGYPEDDKKYEHRVEFSAYFVDGKLKHLEMLTPKASEA